MAQKGSDFLAVPGCRECHERLHNERLTPSREDLLELIVIQLVCYVRTLPEPGSVEPFSEPTLRMTAEPMSKILRQNLVQRTPRPFSART